MSRVIEDIRHRQQIKLTAFLAANKSNKTVDKLKRAARAWKIVDRISLEKKRNNIAPSVIYL